MSEPASLFADRHVMAAQKRNAERMTDEKLVKEFRMVSMFPEQPPIRVAYIAALRDEIAKRGLTELTL